jgi:hypothetical protein
LLAQPAARSSSANAPPIKLNRVGKCLIGNWFIASESV